MSRNFLGIIGESSSPLSCTEHPINPPPSEEKESINFYAAMAEFAQSGVSVDNNDSAAPTINGIPIGKVVI